jgi:hypothetical protein
LDLDDNDDDDDGDEHDDDEDSKVQLFANVMQEASSSTMQKAIGAG